MNVAVFDLDNTLLGGDSDYLWGEFLVEHRYVEAHDYADNNRRFHAQYQAGTLDIYAYLRFQLRVLAAHDMATLLAWRECFLHDKIMPIMLTEARHRLDHHRRLGHVLLILTATNRFVTEPIAKLFGVDNLLATEPACRDGRYTGDIVGPPCYRDGKVTHFEAWLTQHRLEQAQTWFYSDSFNDLPMLLRATHAIAVDPDPILHAEAKRNRWPIISLRAAEQSEATAVDGHAAIHSV